MDTRTIRRIDIKNHSISEIIKDIEKSFDDFYKHLEDSFVKLNNIAETAKEDSQFAVCAYSLSDELFTSFPDKIDFMNTLYDIVADRIGDEEEEGNEYNEDDSEEDD